MQNHGLPSHLAKQLLLAGIFGLAGGTLAFFTEIMITRIPLSPTVMVRFLGWTASSHLACCLALALCFIVLSLVLSGFGKSGWFYPATSYIPHVTVLLTLGGLLLTGIILNDFQLQYSLKLTLGKIPMKPFSLLIIPVLMFVIALGLSIVLRRLTGSGYRMIPVGILALIGIAAVPFCGIDDFFHFLGSGEAPPERTVDTDEEPDEGMPNVVLIVLDTLRADRLGCCGSDLGLTPNIDRYAAMGTLFPRVICQSPWTIPSSGSIITGLDALEHGLFRDVLVEPGKLPFIPVHLKKSSYRTAGIFANFRLSSIWGWDSIFDYYFNLADKPWMTGSAHRYIQSAVLFIRYMLEPKSTDGDRLTDLTIDWLKRSSSSPFFLWVHYMDPHKPYGDRENVNPTPGYTGRFMTSFDQNPPPVNSGSLDLTPEEKEHIENLYNSDVRFCDREVGRLLDYLKESGRLDDSVVIITSDHGEEFWEHGYWEHGHSVHREVVEVPILLLWPDRLPRGKVVGSQVRLIDIAPTIYDLLGISAAGDLAGESLLPLVHAPGPDRPAICAKIYHGEDRISRRSDGLLTVLWLSSDRLQAYDLGKDPDETTDLFASPEHREDERLQRARDELRTILEEQEQRRIEIRGTGDVKMITPPEEALERLRALGYVQ